MTRVAQVKFDMVKWLGVSLVLALIFGTMYLISQQVLRQGANDPQIQLAEDTATRAANGDPPIALIAGPNVDVGQSLAPFVIIYDGDSQAVASSARLNGQTPSLPAGVLKSTTPGHENRLTWQPQPDVRIATVVVARDGSTGHRFYVLSGRSLREVEKRETQVELATLAGWLASELVLACLLSLL